MNYLVDEKHSGERIDKFLVGVMENVSRTDVQKLIAAGEVKVGGAPASKNFRVETGMVVVVEKLIEKPSSTLEPEEIPLDIVYEDDDIVVLNKPRNLVVHPGNGVSKGTLAAGLLHHFKDNLSAVNGPLRPGIVHRLDKDTPGLMVVAKNDAAHRHWRTSSKPARCTAPTMRSCGAARAIWKAVSTRLSGETRRTASRWRW